LSFAYFVLFSAAAEWILNGRLVTVPDLIPLLITAFLATSLIWVSRRWFHRPIDAETLVSLLSHAWDANEPAEEMPLQDDS
jgi:hypothetical protein